jgi:hypothetical protein
LPSNCWFGGRRSWHLEFLAHRCAKHPTRRPEPLFYLFRVVVVARCLESTLVASMVSLSLELVWSWPISDMVRVSLHQLVPTGLSSNVDRSNRGGGRCHWIDSALCKTKLNFSVPTVVITSMACLFTGIQLKKIPHEGSIHIVHCAFTQHQQYTCRYQLNVHQYTYLLSIGTHHLYRTCTLHTHKYTLNDYTSSFFILF